MATRADYALVKAEVEGRGAFTTIRTDEHGRCNLVCASSKSSDGLHGSSFWIWFCKKTGDWYLCTWCPCYYRIPSKVDLAGLCVECLALQNRAIFELPPDFVYRHNLVEIQEEHFDKLYCEN